MFVTDISSGGNPSNFAVIFTAASGSFVALIGIAATYITANRKKSEPPKPDNEPTSAERILLRMLEDREQELADCKAELRRRDENDRHRN